MIQQPKKPLYSRSFFLILSSIIFSSLVGFFYCAIQYQNQIFLFLGAALFISTLSLLPFRARLQKARAHAALERQDYVEKTNLLEVEKKQYQDVLQSLHKKILNYSQLKGLTEQLSLCLSLEETSNTLSNEVSHLFGGKDITVILYLFHSKVGELGLSSSQKGEMQVNIKSKKGDIFDQWVVKTMQPLLVEDTRSDFRFDINKANEEDTRDYRSLISVPLMTGNKALGILKIDSPEENRFTMEELRFLKTIADLGAIAIENAQLYEKLEELAIKDSLTGLYLRRYFLERLDKEMIRDLRAKQALSFLMIDLDDFKKYNDQYGHMAGDIVLKRLGVILVDAFKKPGDMVARYGGEEFAVCLPNCTKERAVNLAEKLRQAIVKEIITLRRVDTKITVSIGVASCPEDSKSKEGLIDKADQALYRAKKEGRNRVCVA